MKDLKISYDGEYPCLCMGILKVEKNSNIYKIEHVLMSGGNIWITDDGDAGTNTGSWDLDLDRLPEELKAGYEQIKEWVNNNIELGCCGGCI